MADAQINLVVIRSADLERSAQFYRLLGLDFTKHRHGKGLEHYASETGPVVFEIYPRSSEAESSSGLRIGFRVASVDEALASLQGGGAIIVSSPKDSPWGRRAVVDDPTAIVWNSRSLLKKEHEDDNPPSRAAGRLGSFHVSPRFRNLVCRGAGGI